MRQGKFIELELAETDQQQGQDKVEAMCSKLLANTVIENYAIELVGSDHEGAVLVFPGSNRESDVAKALESAMGKPPVMVWHRDSELPKVDLIVVPGGFSYGDYLRCGAIAAQSPVHARGQGARPRQARPCSASATASRS